MQETAQTTSMSALVRQASPAVQDALRESMRGLAEAKRDAGFTSSAAPPPAESAMEMARTASALSRATGAKTPRLSHLILKAISLPRQAPSGKAEKREMMRFLTGISKASIAEMIRIIPGFTVGDLRTLYQVRRRRKRRRKRRRNKDVLPLFLFRFSRCLRDEKCDALSRQARDKRSQENPKTTACLVIIFHAHRSSFGTSRRQRTATSRSKSSQQCYQSSPWTKVRGDNVPFVRRRFFIMVLQ